VFGIGHRWRVFTIRGIPFYVASSWLLIGALYLSAEYARASGSTGSGEAIWLAFLSFVLFFGGVLIHEGAHAVVARAFDLPVTGVTLVFWGGATETRASAKGPLAEFLVAFAGPFSTLVLAGAFWVAGSAMDPGPARDIVHYLAFINLLFAAFNALPGFPLDGGRMLLATAWAITHRRRTALQVAGYGGVVIGIAIIAFAFWDLSQGSGFVVRAIWLGWIGFTLVNVGRSMQGRVQLRDALEGVKISDAMRPPTALVPADISLSEALDRYLRGGPETTFPVVDEGGALVGTVSMASARKVGASNPLRPVRDGMVPIRQVAVFGQDEALDDTIEWLGGREGLVVSDGQVVGMIAARDVEAWYRRRTEPATVPQRPDL
jgi:Zn-dependent protease